MKKLIVALMLVAFAATTAMAANVVTYKCKKGTVTFDHGMHQAKVADSCKNVLCHGDAAPAKIVINKHVAHSVMCKKCHKTNAGPTKCNGCHKK